nr:MAG TPA: hypothetical protein [Caudoviricetes sp.]DAY80499.1 MAG TPA: hypothetical protein [Caudoviricetes sp.]
MLKAIFTFSLHTYIIFHIYYLLLLHQKRTCKTLISQVLFY